MKLSIVLVITDTESNAQVTPYGGRFTEPLGVDFLELRVDLFRTIANMIGPGGRSHRDKKFIEYARRQFANRRKLRIPLILTIRNQRKEGAKREFSDALKWELLEALVPLADWVDVEISSPICAKTVALVRSHKKKVLISAHDFNRIPHLEQVFKKALSTGADMVKIAAQANSPQDLIRMMEFTAHHKKQPLVTMCVGQWGPLSRLVLPAVGSRWVYTFLSKPTAPGQLDLKTLRSVLKYPVIS